MRPVHRKTKPRKSRRYHQVDRERFAFDENENPDWLVGAY